MQDERDPAVQWARYLDRLDGHRLGAVAEALRHSSATGFPASEVAVRLLVDYSLGAISARDYAVGILRSFGVSAADIAPLEAPAATHAYTSSSPSAYVAADVAHDPAPAESHRPGEVRREDAVRAYVSGQIPVSEFLRISRT